MKYSIKLWNYSFYITSMSVHVSRVALLLRMLLCIKTQNVRCLGQIYPIADVFLAAIPRQPPEFVCEIRLRYPRRHNYGKLADNSRSCEVTG